MRISRTIPLPPVGKPRPRVTRYGGVYYPGDYDKWRQDLRRMFGAIDLTGNLRLTLHTYQTPPSTLSGRRLKAAERAALIGRHCRVVPDADNVLGAVMDALFPDGDSHIVEVAACKWWWHHPALVITLEELPADCRAPEPEPDAMIGIQ